MASQNSLKLIFKSNRLNPFRASQTRYLANPDTLKFSSTVGLTREDRLAIIVSKLNTRETITQPKCTIDIIF